MQGTGRPAFAQNAAAPVGQAGTHDLPMDQRWMHASGGQGARMQIGRRSTSWRRTPGPHTHRPPPAGLHGWPRARCLPASGQPPTSASRCLPACRAPPSSPSRASSRSIDRWSMKRGVMIRLDRRDSGMCRGDIGMIWWMASRDWFDPHVGGRSGAPGLASSIARWRPAGGELAVHAHAWSAIAS